MSSLDGEALNEMFIDKQVLDPCCGGRMFWFQKHHPDVLYCDIRTHEPEVLSNGQTFSVSPDMIADFRDLPFPDEHFKLVVFDPPHLKSLRETSYMAKKYGVLNAETWPFDIGRGFSECWRTLAPGGTLIFKWNEHDIPLKDVLRVLPERPLFGHPTSKHGKTHWMVFFKGAIS